MEPTEMDIFDIQKLQEKIDRLENERRLLQLTEKVYRTMKLLKSGNEGV